MKILISFILFFVTGSISGFAQYYEFIGNTIDVELEGYKGGKIQWQFSTDQQNWNDIKDATSDILTYRAIESGYFRARVVGCPEVYFSDTTHVYVDSRLNRNPIEEKYKYKNRLWQGCPSIEMTPNGRLWATYFSGDTGEGKPDQVDNWILLVYSDDNGKTWTNPIVVIDPTGSFKAHDPGLWFGPDEKLWFFWGETKGRYDGIDGLWAATSTSFNEENPNWTKPHRICDGVMSNKPIVCSNSDILYPVALWELWGGENNPNKGDNVYCSKDSGNTISFLSRISIPQSTFNENMIVERKDSTLWMLTRTGYGISEVVSFDQGRTWVDNKRSSLYNADARFHIRKLKSGNLLFIHHNPPNKDLSRTYLTASLSEDDGKSWKYNLLIDLRENAAYPDATSEDESGNIYMIYDFDRGGKKNILTCRFTENSIKNGRFFETDLKPSVIKEGTSKINP